jgi:cyclopropane-fatty-acyl-phospholipid synthase
MNKSQDYQFLWQALEKAQIGHLQIILPEGEIKNFGKENANLKAQITIKNFNFLDEIISGGDIAFGEAYMQGDFDSENLANLLEFFTLNAQTLEDFFHARKFKAFLFFLQSFFRKNTKRGSKKNIKAHYDLGNDFYSLWLDESMTYSSAVFAGKDISLKDAQTAKYQNILEKLNQGPILEIGCGWGGFAQMAAEKNHEITCLTISEKQKEFAQNRIKKAGLENLAKIKLQDYRNENSSYQNVVSIEMFEAVGRAYWDKYFKVIHNNLDKNGKAILQIITIDEEVFKGYLKRTDFIQKHIFPGGILPSKTEVRKLATQNSFTIKSELAFGLDYAKTLEIWLENFDAKKAEIFNLGFDEKFIRKWRFYLCYCIAGFKAGRIDVVQFELDKISCPLSCK